MADKFFSERNLKFLMYDVQKVDELTGYPYYEEHSREMFDLVLDTAAKMSRDIIKPIFQEMDQQQPELVDGEVKVHPKVRDFLKECGEGGWIGANAPFELEGQQLPFTITAASAFIMGAANFSAQAYPFLTAGASELIELFADEELKEKFIPKMFTGEWQGTMALTEPQAGSSLSDVAAMAEPTDDGYYKIKGQKIFISAGDHDGVDNVVHLMLARIKGAPAGVKGISLFIVPKKRPEADGLVSNDISVAGIYHKMGYRGCPITQLSMGENDDCRGWLVGEPHKGLSYMFRMMNGARVGVGMQATSIATAAYYASLEYAKERPQGRRLAGKDPNTPQVNIIEHSDVKRMLLFQRAVVEGSLSLLFRCSKLNDLTRVTEGEENERNFLLLDILTPVAKTYPSEMGILSVSQGLQILGGYGYCDEFPLEQYFRDMRIHPIHEGTTGIQGLDLLGRKVVMKDGRAFKIYVEELEKSIREAGKDPVLAPYAHRLETALEKLQEVTKHLMGIAMSGDIENFLADATLYLELFGIVTMAWEWLNQGIAVQEGLKGDLSESESQFYQGKLFTLKYFYHYELPKIQGPAARLLETEAVTFEMKEEFFND